MKISEESVAIESHGWLKMGTGKGNITISFPVLLLLFFSPVLAYVGVGLRGGNTLLFEDGLLQSFPFRAFVHNAFVNGFSPQWVPNSACGVSLLAEGQNGICFPSTQILYRIFSAQTGWMIEILLAQAVAFIFCYWLLRHLSFSRVGSLLGASVYTFCPLAFNGTSVPALMWCYSLLPGLFVALGRYLERKRVSTLFLVMMSALVLLTGHPVMIIYIGMICFIYVIFHCAEEWRRGVNIRDMGIHILGLVGIGLIAVLIASPQLLPILQQYPISARTVDSGVSLADLQSTMHLNPLWIPLSLFPTPVYWGGWEFWSNSIRFPFYALFLALIGLISSTGGSRRGYFLFLLVFSFLMALGPHVGLWKLVHSLPGLNHLRFPLRWLFFLPICVAFFTARGVDQLFNGTKILPLDRFVRLLNFLLLMGGAVSILFIVRYHVQLLEQTRKGLETAPYLAGLLWICTGGMVLSAFLSLTKRGAPQGVALGIGLTVTCLLASLAFQVQDPMVVRDLKKIGWESHHIPSAPQEFRSASAQSPYDVWMTNSIDHRYGYTPNLTILNGTLSTGHYFSYYPYWSANVSEWSRDALNGDRAKLIYLNLSSAKWLFTQDRMFSNNTDYSPSSFMGASAFRNTDAMPRASVVYSYRPFPDEKSLIAFLEASDRFDASRDLLVLGRDAEAWGLQINAKERRAIASPPKATIVTERPDHIVIEIDPSPTEDAFLVLNDTFYPGWRASVDGAERKILRANYAFRSIQLPRGAKKVVFFFDPFIPDAVLPLPTIVLVAIGLLIGLRSIQSYRIRSGSLGRTGG